MKGMDRISRGSGFHGTTSYLQDGSKSKPREYSGIVIGGNVTSRDAKRIAQELAATKSIRPDVSKPVWHNSLRLPKGETVTHSKWNEIGDEYMRQMGFSSLHPRAYYLHDDKDGQHIHIVASRIAYDGKLYLGKNENLKSTKIIKGLEKTFGLTQTKGAEYEYPRGSVKPRLSSKLTKNEIDKAIRCKQSPVRSQLQMMVSEAIIKPISATHFVELLQAGGVDVRANIASTGRLNGFKFGLNGVWFSGSKLGKDFTCAALVQRGLNYEKDRDGEFLSKFGAGSGDDKSYARAAKRLAGDEASLDRASKRNTCPQSQSGATKRETKFTDIEHANSILAAAFNGKYDGNNFSGVTVNHSSGVGPVKTGNKIADELAWEAHQSNLEESRKAVRANQKYLQTLAEQEAAEHAKKVESEQAEKIRQKQFDAEHEKIVRIAEGLGFAMKTKIKTTKVEKDESATVSKKTRRNTVPISGDAAPGRN